jgi:uncharacterized protein (UPF0333 family)
MKKEVKVKKRGQAAMEFLMTYGWAILAAVIVVGVLWYLLGNPANLAGNQFQLSAPLVQKGLIVNTTGVTVNILNGAADVINVTNINMTSSVPNCAWTNVAGVSVGVGAEQSFYMTCTQIKGARLNSDVVFYFYEGTSTFRQTSTGSISGRVP